MARGLNEVRLLGNLTRDPEIKTTENGKKLCKFGIATNRSWKDEDGTIQTKTDFHNIICWGRKAEVYGEYLKKGSKVLISGRIENQQYVKDGKTRTYSQILATDIIMLDKKPTDQPDQEQEIPTGDINIESDETEPMPF
jgi:single-strand DNA-binding protein